MGAIYGRKMYDKTNDNIKTNKNKPFMEPSEVLENLFEVLEDEFGANS